MSLLADLVPIVTADTVMSAQEYLVLAGAYIPLFLALVRPDAAALAMAVAMVANVFWGAPLRLAIPLIIVGTVLALTVRRRTSITFYAFVVVWALVLGSSPSSAQPGILWGFLPLITLAMGVGVAVAELQRHRRADAARIQDLEAQERAARLEERRRLATELHDIVAHDVTLIAMQSQMGLRTDDPARSEAIFATVNETARRALDDLRRLVDLLRHDLATADVDSDDLAATSATAALRDDLTKLEQELGHLGYRVRVTIDGDLDAVPASLRHSLRRTLRESITNVVKHGGEHAEVRIALTITADEVRFRAVNDVKDRPGALPSGGRGLSALAERAKIFQGTCRYGRQGDQFIVELTLPLHRSPS